MAKKIKLGHMYEDWELYSLLIQRTFREFAAESHLTAMALTWYYGNYLHQPGKPGKAPPVKPLSVLEVFAGNGTKHWPMIQGNIPFKVARFEQLDLLEHPQSKANGVTVGNLLSYKFEQPFDIIYSPWDNMGVLLPEKGQYPTFAGLVEGLSNCYANLKTGGCVSIYPTCTPEELLGPDAEGVQDEQLTLEIPPFDALRRKFKLDMVAPLLLVSDYYMEFDRHSRVFSEYYHNPRILSESGAVLVAWTVKGKNQIRCWSENELVDAIYLAGFSNTHFLHSQDDATLIDLADVDGLTLERAQILLATK